MPTCPGCLDDHDRKRPLCGPCEYRRRKRREVEKGYDYRLERRATQRRSARRYWRKSKRHRRANRSRERQNIKYYIRDLVRRAIKFGILTRPKVCEIGNSACGGQIEAHHCDYNVPLQVRWLCRRHHMAWHRLFRATEIGDSNG